jgi:hypothetical protein
MGSLTVQPFNPRGNLGANSQNQQDEQAAFKNRRNLSRGYRLYKDEKRHEAFQKSNQGGGGGFANLGSEKY